MKPIRRFVLLLLTVFALLFPVQEVWAAKKTKQVRQDSSAVTVRSPEQEAQEDAYTDSDYRYDKSAGPEEPGFLERFLNWVLRTLFGTEEGSRTWKVIIMILAVLVLVGIILLLTRTNVRQLFFSKKAEGEVGDGEVFDIDIHELNFEERISDALRKGDYRLAVRLQYLFILKKLSDKKLIQWRIDRTNYDYYLHLAGSSHQEKFRQVSLIYDYCWYGDFHVTESDYRNVENQFSQFSSSVS